MTDQTSQVKKTDQYIPWIFVLMFAVVVLVNSIMIYFALRTQTGVVSEKAYEEGVEYNKIIASKQKQDAMCWQGLIDIKNNVLTFSLKDDKGRLISNAHVKAALKRPVEDGMDFTVDLQPADDGTYKKNLQSLAEGQWSVRIFAKSKENNYQISKIFELK